jgi:hypothetical protein
MEEENEDQKGILDRRKPFGARVSAWALHDLAFTLEAVDINQLFLEQYPGCAPVFFTGQVDKDHLRRWRSGSAMRSSLVVAITPGDNCWHVETENTLYTLYGPGRISNQFPLEYNSEVGKTLTLIDPNRVSGPEDSNHGHVVYPDREESLIPFRELMEAINAKNRA